MSTYVMSDIHGCYVDMIKMIEKIELSDEDVLIFAGDYIDRGPKSYEMIKWIEQNLNKAIFLKGNHEVEFAYGISLMQEMCKKNEWSEESLEDTRIVFALIKQASQGVFDYYGTIQNLIEIHGCTLSELTHYANMFEDLDCTFYDIDCGCSAKGKRDGAKLACIRLDDEQIYYI